MDKFSPIESEQAHSFQNIQRLYFPPFYKQKQTGFANLFCSNNFVQIPYQGQVKIVLFKDRCDEITKHLLKKTLV